MGELWDKFYATGKVDDYLAYCSKEEKTSHGISYRSDGNGTLCNSHRRVRQESDDSHQGEREDNSFC